MSPGLDSASHEKYRRSVSDDEHNTSQDDVEYAAGVSPFL